MRKLFIHIGTHKTGSTTIKSALAKNRKFFVKHGLLYVNTKWSYEIMRLESADSSLKERIYNEFTAAVNQHDPKGKLDVVIAAEKFSGNPYKAYGNAAILAEILKHAASGFEPIIVVYLRRQDTFLESLYTQSIHQGGSETFVDFLERVKVADYQWQQLIDSFAGEFGGDKVKVRSYDYVKSLGSQGLLNDFLETIGYGQCIKELPDAGIRKEVNVGYSPEAVHFARLTNKYVPAEKQKAFRKALQASNRKQKGEQYAYMESGERTALFSKFSDANRVLANRWMEEEHGNALCSLPVQKEEPKKIPSNEEVFFKIVANYMAYNESKPKSDPESVVKNVMMRYFPRVYRFLLNIIG